jgi:hypothetical protein
MDGCNNMAVSLDPADAFPMRHQTNVPEEVGMSTRGNTLRGKPRQNPASQSSDRLSAALSIGFAWLVGQRNWSFRCVSPAVAESVLTVN